MQPNEVIKIFNFLIEKGANVSQTLQVKAVHKSHLCCTPAIYSAVRYKKIHQKKTSKKNPANDGQRLQL